MNSDCAIKIGSTHSICQDYGRHGNDALGNPYVIISDGCSSSVETDIGARLLVLAAEKNINMLTFKAEDEAEFLKNSVLLAAKWAKEMSLPEICIDATLATAKIHDGLVSVMIHGDGQAIFGKTTENGLHLEVYDVSTTHNFPFYPSYMLKPERLKSMPATNEMAVSLYEIHEEKALFPQKSYGRFYPAHGWNDEPLDPDFRKYFHQTCMLDRFDFVALTTDGVNSFLTQKESTTSKENESIDGDFILPDLVGFKNFNPGFVQRRLQKFDKEIKAKGWQHYDDLTIGAIALK